MRKILSFIGVAIFITLFIACNEQKEKVYLEEYTEKLLAQYPNYRSNDIAQKALTDSIENHAKRLVGKEPIDIKGLDFDFIDMVEKDGEHGAIFRADCYADIDSKASKTKYLIATAQIVVFTVVSDEIAAKLDANEKYHINGILMDWEKTDYSYRAGIADIEFGTYFLKDATITPISTKQ